MDAVEMLKEMVRLTDSCEIDCDDCKLSSEQNGTGLSCEDMRRENPEKCVEIIEQWSKDCPKQTYLSKLLEIFPGTVLEADGTPARICPSELGLKDFEFCGQNCIDCWNQEYEEAQND